MSTNYEINKLNLKAMDALCDVLVEIQEAERKYLKNGVEKYISDAVHEKLYELWDAVVYCHRTMSIDEYEDCFNNSEALDLSPEEFIEKINNYIFKKKEKDSKEIVTGDEIEVHFYEPLEHLNDFLTDDDKHLYYLNTMSDGYVMALSKTGASTKVRVDSVKKTGKHYNSFKEFAEDNS